MSYKPFPLVAPTDPFQSSRKSPRPVPSCTEQAAGRSLRPSTHGVRGVYLRPSLLASAPEKLRRKQLSESQKAAAYVKFLDDQGWRAGAIAAALKVQKPWVYAVLQYRIHKKVMAEKPQWLAEAA
jgi:hypothetical protein